MSRIGTLLSETTFDIVIVGGGPVGLALALALRDTGLSMLLLDARPTEVSDRRSLALSFGSRALLERLGAWQRIEAATPIESIHVSQRGGFGRTLLTAREQGIEALGYVCGYADLHAALSECVARCEGVRVCRPAQARSVGDAGALKAIALEQDGLVESVYARLVVIADGGALANTLAHISHRDYHQCAVVATVSTDTAHGNRAYERFTAQGPVALLPSGDDFALVWTTRPARAQQLKAMQPDQFLCALQDTFGTRAGRFTKVAACAIYPLALRIAGKSRQHAVVLLGNAAQVLHPVAGQGLNLGLRDVTALVERLTHLDDPTRLADAADKFERTRALDRYSTAFITDLLVTIFSNDVTPLRALRGGGLALLDMLAPLKRAFADRMMFGA
ncbi:MAG TPA: FAD-dependent monooxygenase [Burkholderiales bacterium]|nr:FAD-dependent monooxygenase [Burkholderiales bacterium]